MPPADRSTVWHGYGMTASERVLSVGTVARLIGVSSETVRAWARAGRIRAIRTPTGRYKIPEAVAEALLAELTPVDASDASQVPR